MKQERFTVRFSPLDIDAIDRFARRGKKRRSEFIREIVLEKLKLSEEKEIYEIDLPEKLERVFQLLLHINKVQSENFEDLKNFLLSLESEEHVRKSFLNRNIANMIRTVCAALYNSNPDKQEELKKLFRDTKVIELAESVKTLK